MLRLAAMDRFNITVKNIRQQINSNIYSNNGNSKQHFETNIGPEIFNYTIYNALALPIIFFMETKFGT